MPAHGGDRCPGRGVTLLLVKARCHCPPGQTPAGVQRQFLPGIDALFPGSHGARRGRIRLRGAALRLRCCSSPKPPMLPDQPPAARARGCDWQPSQPMSAATSTSLPSPHACFFHSPSLTFFFFCAAGIPLVFLPANQGLRPIAARLLKEKIRAANGRLPRPEAGAGRCGGGPSEEVTLREEAAAAQHSGRQRRRRKGRGGRRRGRSGDSRRILVAPGRC